MTIGMGRTTCIRFIDRRLLTGPLGAVALRVGFPCGFFGPSSVPRSWVYTVALHLRGSLPRHLCCGSDFSIPSLFHGAASPFLLHSRFRAPGASILLHSPENRHITPTRLGMAGLHIVFSPETARLVYFYPHKVGEDRTPYRIYFGKHCPRRSAPLAPPYLTTPQLVCLLYSFFICIVSVFILRNNFGSIAPVACIVLLGPSLHIYRFFLVR